MPPPAARHGSGLGGTTASPSSVARPAMAATKSFFSCSRIAAAHWPLPLIRNVLGSGVRRHDRKASHSPGGTMPCACKKARGVKPPAAALAALLWSPRLVEGDERVVREPLGRDVPLPVSGCAGESGGRARRAVRRRRPGAGLPLVRPRRLEVARQRAVALLAAPHGSGRKAPAVVVFARSWHSLACASWASRRQDVCCRRAMVPRGWSHTGSGHTAGRRRSEATNQRDSSLAAKPARVGGQLIHASVGGATVQVRE